MDNRMDSVHSNLDLSCHGSSDDPTISSHKLSSRQLSMFDLGAKVFVNSLPKSGTHLVTSMLELMPGLTRQYLPLLRKLGRHPLNYLPFSNKKVLTGIGKPCEVKLHTLAYMLKKIKHGSFAAGHIPYHPLVINLLNANNIWTFFVIRDPRDVVVSQAYYGARTKRNVVRKHYSALSSDKERFKTAILGAKKEDGQSLTLGIADRLGLILSWLQTDGVMNIRFEDIIGARGGGDPEKQIQSILAAGIHIGISLTEAQAQTIGDQMFGAGTTFRKGTIGDWQSHFDEELKDIFKETAGHHLIKLGYVNDSNW